MAHFGCKRPRCVAPQQQSAAISQIQHRKLKFLETSLFLPTNISFKFERIDLLSNGTVAGAYFLLRISTSHWFFAFASFCADLPSPSLQDPVPVLKANAPDALLRPDSIFVFGGALSTSSLGSTLKFNLDQPAGTIKYDNYIAGAAYNHDFYKLGFGFTLGVEVGIADRFGHYALCCNTIIKSSSLLNSGELWAGPRISFDGFVLFDTIRIAGAATTGFSFTTDSIGRERERELAYGGSARALIYFGPEIIISMVNHPELEFVYREQHRSGANGTFGKMREGYNANVFGVRYKF